MNPDNSRTDILQTIVAAKASEEAANKAAAKNDMFQVIGSGLLRYGSDEAIFGGSELEGFLAAIVCSPQTIMPTKWFPLIWGGEQHAPDWEDSEELSRFSNAMFVYYSIVSKDFQEYNYEPLFLEGSSSDADMLLVDEWCDGFLRGISLWGELSPQDMEQLEQCLHPIRHCSTRENPDAPQSMDEAEMRWLQASIKPRLDALYQHFFKPVKPAGATFIHGSPKVGRNEPCSCGSGKKYKKCCALQ